MTPIPPAESRQDRYAVRVIEELRRMSALLEEMCQSLRGARDAFEAFGAAAANAKSSLDAYAKVVPREPAAPGREVVRKVTETRPDGRTVVNRVREVRP
jgi:hypothetical protein